MTLKDIEFKIQDIELKIEKVEQYLEQGFLNTQPKAVKFDKETVSGGSKIDSFADYIASKEYFKPLLKDLKREYNYWNDYKNKKLNLLKKYDKFDEEIIMLRETTNLTWTQIAIKTNNSVHTCKYIYYKKYKKGFIQ